MEHPDNTHWDEWRSAVERTGYTPELAHAALALETLANMSAEQFEMFASRQPLT